MALWALAKLRANRPKLLRVLADRADALSGEMNPQDLATVMWAYGSLQHRPDAAVLQRLALAAASQFEEFQPQVRALCFRIGHPCCSWVGTTCWPGLLLHVLWELRPALRLCAGHIYADLGLCKAGQGPSGGAAPPLHAAL